MRGDACRENATLTLHFYFLPPSLLCPLPMSEKIREFLEVPQQFVRDGNQVCVVAVASTGSNDLSC